MAGKGDRYRPVNKERYDKNYERIFGKRKHESGERKHEPGSADRRHNTQKTSGGERRS